FAGRSLSGSLRGGRRGRPDRASGSRASYPPLAPAYQEAGLEGGRGAQPGHAHRRHRQSDGSGGPDPDHDRQSRFRRPEFHRKPVEEDRGGKKTHRGRGPRHCARSGWRHHARDRQTRHRRGCRHAGGGNGGIPGRSVALCRQHRGAAGLTMAAAVSINLLPELMEAGMRRMLTPFRVWRRRNWFYRRLLKGPLTDHIAFQPHDSCPRRLEDADALFKGRFRFHGEVVDVRPGVSVFDLTPPSPTWLEELHGFCWLASLALAGGEASRTLATNLIAQWVKRYGHYCEPQWSPHVTARRLMNIFSHGRLVVSNSDMVWRSRLFVSLREQVKMLERTAAEAPGGLPRLEAASALALSGLCLSDNSRRLNAGLARLEAEIARQILPDGGHVSRSPEELLHAYRYLMMVKDGLASANEEPPHGLRNALDRMAPMLRFFRHGDGALA